MSDAVENLPSPKEQKKGGGKTLWVLIAAMIWFPAANYYIVSSAAGSGASESSHASTEGPKAETRLDHAENQMFTIENLVVNLSDSFQSRYLKASFIVEGNGANFEEAMRGNEAKLVDQAITVLSNLTVADINEGGLKERIKILLINEYNNLLPDIEIRNIYFTEFVFQ